MELLLARAKKFVLLLAFAPVSENSELIQSFRLRAAAASEFVQTANCFLKKLEVLCSD